MNVLPFWFWAPNFVSKIARATPVLGLKPSGGDGRFYSGDRKRRMRLLSKKFNDI